MARLPFIDTHFHLHDMKRAELRYSWLEPDAIHPFLGNIDAIKAQHYWIEDYIAEIRFSNVPKAIHVQAALGIKDPVDETRWLQAFADEFGYPQGIVAECHLAEPDAGEMLEHLGQKPAADAILKAIERVLAAGSELTPDMGGKASTPSLAEAVADAL